MRENTSTESQLKNEEFKKEIRSRLKADYMKRIRNQFLKIQDDCLQKRVCENMTIADVGTLTAKPAEKDNIAALNRIIITSRSDINENLFETLLTYIRFNFLEKDPITLLDKIQLNDLIALFSNILAIQTYHHHMARTINFQETMEKLFVLLDQAPVQTGSLALWVLFQMVQIFPNLPIDKIVEIQLSLLQKFGIYNIYLTYLLCAIAEKRPDLIDPTIIHEYTETTMNPQSEIYFYENLIIIFSMFLIGNRESTGTRRILKWTGACLVSPSSSLSTKTIQLKLIHLIVKSNMDQSVLADFLNQVQIIYELIQRSLYDTKSENKIISIECLNELVKLCPKKELQELLFSYPSIIEAITSSLSLLEFSIVVMSLASVAKIIMFWPDKNEIRNILDERNLRMELESLQYSKNDKISNMAIILLEDYFK